jgi:succinate dehydrogenase / fumarate reductase cytochrome b subunit
MPELQEVIVQTEQKLPIQYRKPLKWGELDPHRRENARIGMWAWLWQRISALAAVVLLALHVVLPYRLSIQFLLLLVVTFHASLGLRVILLDFNLVSVRYQRALIWGLVALGLAVMLTIWFSIY